MPDDDTPTSFDALAHEHNLSDRQRDICRRFFRAGLEIGRRQASAQERKVREYHPALDRDTAPGEFR
jgi:hypothetical protein